jgi:predicted flap endonuclease-1-like 5' DNA nuclease
VAKDRINDAREAVEERIDQVTDAARGTQGIPTVETRAEVEPDFVENAVTQTEERAEELRSKLEDAMRETRLAAPPEDEGLPVLAVDTSVAPPVEEVVSRAHSLADQLREQAAAAATDTTRDDLARIEGIGERSAQALYKAGVLTFAQLAALSDDEIRQKLEDGGVHPHNTLTSWREQATRFAQESSGQQTESDQSESQ